MRFSTCLPWDKIRSPEVTQFRNRAFSDRDGFGSEIHNRRTRFRILRPWISFSRKGGFAEIARMLQGKVAYNNQLNFPDCIHIEIIIINQSDISPDMVRWSNILYIVFSSFLGFSDGLYLGIGKKGDTDSKTRRMPLGQAKIPYKLCHLYPVNYFTSSTNGRLWCTRLSWIPWQNGGYPWLTSCPRRYNYLKSFAVLPEFLVPKDVLHPENIQHRTLSN